MASRPSIKKKTYRITARTMTDNGQSGHKDNLTIAKFEAKYAREKRTFYFYAACKDTLPFTAPPAYYHPDDLLAAARLQSQRRIAGRFLSATGEVSIQVTAVVDNNVVPSTRIIRKKRGNFSSRTGFYCRSPEFPDPLRRVLFK
jgi:hypothetical protein